MKKQLSRIVSAAFSCLIVLLLALILYGVLAVNNRSVFGCRLFIVETDSMQGTIDAGSLILTRAVPASSLKKGDIITFFSDAPEIYGHPNTHRIIAVKNGLFYTKGDNAPAPDAWPVRPDRVLGRVVFHSAAAGYAMRVLSLPFVVLMLLVAPLTVLIIYDMRDIFRRTGGGRPKTPPGGSGTSIPPAADRPAPDDSGKV